MAIIFNHSKDPIPEHHWALKDYWYLETGTGGNILATTDKVCHLTEYWGLKKPNSSKFFRIIRGIWVYCGKKWRLYKPFATVQSEAGDTLLHTFVHAIWPSCQTHWWTFKGQVEGKNSPSTSAFFKYHRVAPPFGPPVTVKFYSNPHPETTSVDGYAARQAALQTWAGLHNGAGTHAGDADLVYYAGIGSWNVLNTWVRIFRVAMLFNTSTIPVGSLINSARVSIHGASKYNDSAWLATLGVFESFPNFNTAITTADYIHFNDTLLSSVIPYAQFHTPGEMFLNFNQFGKVAIVPGGITKLAIREATYDAPNIAPPWANNKNVSMTFYTAERGGTDRPYLEVTYQPPA